MAGGLPMILLDTCGLLALLDGGKDLSGAACLQLEASGSQVFVSAISAFEIGQKQASGKLMLPLSPTAWFAAVVRHHRLMELPVTSAICLGAASLPLIHRDPFDRLIIATAAAQNLTILTSDRIIPTYPDVITLW
jgi:PIN domain nuclease of toxin-antitoxin system